jgi:hypothetical protein
MLVAAFASWERECVVGMGKQYPRRHHIQSARGGECLGAPNESSVLGVGLHGNGCGGAGGWLLPLPADRGESRAATQHWRSLARMLTLAKRSTAPALSSEYKMAGGLFIFALLRTLNYVIRSRFRLSTPQLNNVIGVFLTIYH